MKMFYVIVAIAIGVLFASCSSDDLEAEKNVNGLEKFDSTLTREGSSGTVDSTSVAIGESDPVKTKGRDD